MVYQDGNMPQLIAANGSKTNGGYCLSISRAEQSRWRSCVAGSLGLAAGASICSDWRSMRFAELRFQGSGRKNASSLETLLMKILFMENLWLRFFLQKLRQPVSGDKFYFWAGYGHLIHKQQTVLYIGSDIFLGCSLLLCQRDQDVHAHVLPNAASGELWVKSKK
ncbi:hypothetical protein GOODEAATRI_007451 [Goodea atripinnis]|uniref:Uncharacterized protein n=1 Tax=Goodea atripinnis TaxID=208336 RepID=A0ABV0MZE8_9TELE